jgi:hypothetical protein
MNGKYKIGLIVITMACFGILLARGSLTFDEQEGAFASFEGRVVRSSDGVYGIEGSVTPHRLLALPKRARYRIGIDDPGYGDAEMKFHIMITDTRASDGWDGSAIIVSS